jgi:hypoxanthine phosphoribosyltransferase
MTHTIRTDYLGKVYSGQFLKLVPEAVKKVRQLRKEFKFDAIAFSGSSGAALAFPLSFFLKIPLIHVRKGSSHYGSGRIEGTISSKKYLIVDDFIDRGNTMKRIMKSINDDLGKEAKPVAIFLYDSMRLASFTYNKKQIPIFFLPRNK